MVAMYVRADNQRAIEDLKAEYPKARTEPGSSYYEIKDRPFDYNPSDDRLRELSSRWQTDVLWLGFQSVVDAFSFHHCERASMFDRSFSGAMGPKSGRGSGPRVKRNRGSAKRSLALMCWHYGRGMRTTTRGEDSIWHYGGGVRAKTRGENSK